MSILPCDLGRYFWAYYVGVIFIVWSYVSMATPVFAEKIEQEAHDIELTAVQSLTENLIGGHYDLDLSYADKSTQVEAKISTFFDTTRVRLIYQYRVKRLVEPNARFSEWKGPEYTILSKDIVISRNALLKDSSFRERIGEYSDVFASKRLFWPQFIGTCTDGIWLMPERNPRGLLERGDRKVVDINPDKINGMNMLHVEYQTKVGDLSIWFCPDRNGLVTRMIRESCSARGCYKTVVDVALKEWSPGIWFPERIETVKTIGQEELIREVAVISSFAAGEPDGKHFDVRGLELPLGAVVADTTSGNVVYKAYTKNGLEPMTEQEVLVAFPDIPTAVGTTEPIDMPLADNRSSNRIGWILGINIVVVVLLVCFVIFRYWKR